MEGSLMSNPSWRDLLDQELTARTKSERLPRIAIAGIGNELRGDDAAGVLVARALSRGMLHYNGRVSVLIIDAGPSPENCTGTLRRFAPAFVLLVDAAQMGETPGTVRYFASPGTVGLSATTHTLPLSVLAKYLTAELGCTVALLGIQPAADSLLAALTPPVKHSVNLIVQYLAESLLK
jgi:hydrogenase 3 maturation protease